MTAVIEVEGLTKHYGSHLAVDDVGFAVTEGEIFGLVGVNGAGKTTTVECLQGLRRPDSGRMRVLGVDPCTAGSELRARVGSQLQASALPDRLRVEEAVRLFGDGDRRSADQLLETWDLGRLRRSSFASLSGGQRQRLFIALALLIQPQAVFFDELTQGLDPLARSGVWGAIRDVRGQGATVVLVTHFMDEAEALCDRVAVMRGGRLVDTGPPADLIARHAPTTTVTFTPPVWLDPATLAPLPGVDRVEVDGQSIRVIGTNQLIAPVCAAVLDADQLGPSDLRVHHPSLEDALVALISEPATAERPDVGASRLRQERPDAFTSAPGGDGDEAVRARADRAHVRVRLSRSHRAGARRRLRRRRSQLRGRPPVGLFTSPPTSPSSSQPSAWSCCPSTWPRTASGVCCAASTSAATPAGPCRRPGSWWPWRSPSWPSPSCW